jgi:hypothetical protein
MPRRMRRGSGQFAESVLDTLSAPRNRDTGKLPSRARVGLSVGPEDWNASAADFVRPSTVLPRLHVGSRGRHYTFDSHHAGHVVVTDLHMRAVGECDCVGHAAAFPVLGGWFRVKENGRFFAVWAHKTVRPSRLPASAPIGTSESWTLTWVTIHSVWSSASAKATAVV